MTDLGTIGGAVSQGYAINASGDILGTSNLRQRRQITASARRQSCHLKQRLRACSTPQSEAIIVEQALSPGGIVYDLFLYTGGAMYDLNALLAPSDPLYGLVHFNAIGRTSGAAMNDSGQIVVSDT